MHESLFFRCAEIYMYVFLNLVIFPVIGNVFFDRRLLGC